MSEKNGKTEIKKSLNDVEIITQNCKKPKHNSKRRKRKCKKNEANSQFNTPELEKVDDIVNYLCNAICKHESETVEKNSTLKVGNESPTIICNGQDYGQNSNSLSKRNLPSTSSSDITNSLQNLQVNETNIPIQGNITEYLNKSFFKKTNSETLHVKELEKIKREESKIIADTSKVSTSNENVIEFFKMNQLQKCPIKLRKKSDSSADEFYRENQNTFQSSGFDLKNNSKQTRAESLSQIKNKEKPKSSKHFPTKDGTKFPKHLSAEELKSLKSLGVLCSGFIRINLKNYKEAYLTAFDKGMDILIEGVMDRNRALDGDEVYYILKSEEHHRIGTDGKQNQRTAIVVGIKKMNHPRGAVGTLNIDIKNKNNSFAIFSPRDSRLPRIRIQKSNWPMGFSENLNSYKDKLYFGKITQWNDVRYAEGEVVKEIGLVGEVEAETEAILLHCDLEVEPYSEMLNQYLPPSKYQISDIEITNREDLRKDCVFTIDPETAVDLDDAMSCKRLPNGNFEIGVHISDVTYFLTEGTPLDSAISERATTVYLVQRAYHMLPFDLCRLCSLAPGEDKLTVSVFWEVTPEGEILSHRFSRTIINSCAQFSYNQVQNLITNSQSSEIVLPKIFGSHSIDKIKENLCFLHKVATLLKFKRFSKGALRIDQTKVRFFLDQNMLPLKFEIVLQEESHQLIEEFMLLANTTVAERLIEYFPKIAFLRFHPSPHSYLLEKMKKSLEKYGIILDITSSGSIQSSMLSYSGKDSESLGRMLVLSNIIAKPMPRAEYYCSGLRPNKRNRRHYALNVALYTHFTSPIRRYADIMTHRLLVATLGYCDPPSWAIEFVDRIASNCNKQKYSAKIAGEMSTELFLAIYIGEKGGIICDAVVCDIKDMSFDCISLSTGTHHRVYFKNIEGEVNPTKKDGIYILTIRWPKDNDDATETTQVIEMFSIVKVKLKRVDVLKIEASLLRYD